MMRSSNLLRRNSVAAGQSGFWVGLGSSLIVASAGMLGAVSVPMSSAVAVSAVAVSALSAWPQGAQAQVNRCTNDRGNLVFTDSPCAAIGANERLPRAAAIPGTGARRMGCARNLQDLIYEITAAVDQRDVNRLGGVYHWVGMSAAGGERILDRLQTIVDRPLVDIVAIRGGGAPRPTAESSASPASSAPTAPSVAHSPPSPSSSLKWPSSQATDSTAAGAIADPVSDAVGESVPRPPAPRRGGLVGLRLEQTLRGSATPSRTFFGLRRHLDCWWVVLPN